jgi:hypothetical protein
MLCQNSSANPLKSWSSGDTNGSYYTSTGSNAQQWAAGLAAVPG